MANERISIDENFKPVIAGVKDTSGDISQIIVDETTKRLLTDTNSVSVGNTVVGSGSLYITAGGRIQQLHSDLDCKRVFIQATEGNSEPVLVGASNVAATLELRNGLALYATQGVWFNVSNLNLLYISSTVAGCSVNYFLEN